MTPTVNTDTQALWSRVVATHRDYHLAVGDFLSAGNGKVETLRQALRGPGRLDALGLALRLSAEERLELFPEWVLLASWAHGSIQRAREVILSLPRDWVLAHIEQEAEQYLREGTYDEYRRFLELYVLLDGELTAKLAKRAAASQDLDVREAGEDFLEHLGLLAANARTS